MQAVSRLLRIASIVLVLLLAVIAAALAGLYGYLRTDAGRSQIAALTGEMLSTPEGTRIAVGGIEGDLFGHFRITDIVLSDPQGQWGQIDRIEALWHPSALLRRRLHVEALAVADVTIARQPLSPPEPEEEPQQPFALPRLPVALRLDALRVSDVTLGEAVLGQRMRLAAQGEAALGREGSAEIALTLARTDAESDRLRLEADYAPEGDSLAAGSLTLAARLDGPAGGLASGLLSRLLGLPEQPAMTAEIAGSGPLLAWDGGLTLDIAEVVALDTRFDGVEDQPLAVRLRGAAEIGPLAPEILRQSLGSELTFRADVGRPAPELIVIEQAALTSDRLRLGASGRLREMNRLEDVRLSLAAERAALSGLAAPAEIGALTLEATASGPLARPEVMAEARVSDLRLEGTGSAENIILSVRSETPTEQNDPLPVALTGTAEGLRFAEARLNGLIGPRLTLRAEGAVAPEAGTARLDGLRLAGEGVSVNAEGHYAAAAQELAAKLQVDVPSLAAADATLAGAARLSAEVTGDLAEQGLVAELDGRISDLETGQAAMRATFGRDLNLSAKAAYALSGRITLDHLHLTGADTRISAEDCVFDPSGPLDCDLAARIGDLAALAPLLGAELAGTLTAQAEIGGTAADPTLSAEAALREGQIMGRPIEALTFAASGTDLLSAPRGMVEARLSGPGGPIGLTAEVVSPEDAPEGTVALRDFRLTGPGLDGRARLTFTRTPMALDGEATLDLASFAALAPFLDAAPSGSAHLEATFDQAQGTQRIRFALRGDDLVLPGATEPALTLDALRLSGSLAGLFDAAAPRLDATLTATDASTPAATLARLESSVSGTLDDLSLRAEAAGTAGPPFALATTARIKRGATTTLTVQDLEGKIADAPLNLTSPARLSLGQRGFALSGLDLRLAQNARITAEGRLAAEALELHATVADLPLDLLALVRPDLPLEGELDLTADLVSTPERRSGELTVSARGVRFAEADPDLVPPLAVALSGDWNGTRASLTGTLRGLSSEPARIAAALPLRVQGEGPLPSPVTTAPVSAALDWAGPVAPLWRLLPLPEHRLSGQGLIEARLGGTLDTPQVSGRVVLRDGSYEHLAFGTRLDDLSLQAVAERSDRLVLALSATDGGRGRLTGEGRIGLDPAGGFATDIRIALAQMRLVDRDDVDGRVSGDLALAGDLSALRLGGHLRTNGVNISLDRSLPPQVAALDVVEAGTPEAAALLGERPRPAAGAAEALIPPEAGEPKAAGPQIALDLEVSFPRQVFVRGRGLDTEWEGELIIGGSADAPRIRGQLDLVRGDFTLAGERLDLDRGVITFTGGTEIDPVLDIVAVYEAEELTARIAITGTPSDPEITLSSTPELPQDEILAQIIYGKSAAGLSPLEALQLARSVATLTGAGPQGPGVLSSIRGSLGLDVLRFGGEEDTGPTVDIGKYVTEDVYVGVEQGVQQGTGAVTVEIELAPRISVETDVGATDSRIGLNWTYDY